MSYTLYMHIFPNDKVYIGITCQKPESRWGKDGNAYQHNQYMQNAILKYGWNNIKHEILHTGLTKEAAEQKEIELIAKYKSNQREYGYNIENGGHVNCVSDETKRKLSQIRKGRKLTQEQKMKISCSLLGREVSQLTKKRISEALKGREATEEAKAKMSIARKGKSSWNKGKELSQEHKTKLKAAKAHKTKKVLCVETNCVYESVRDAEKQLGLSHGNLAKCCNNVYGFKTCGGYHWKYIDEKVKEVMQ